jgi:hypothetical protein
MKILKGLAIVSITLVLGSCFDPPEFPNVPQIEFESIQFKRGTHSTTGSTPDSLKLTLSFKDGDGDLGIDPADPKYLSAPFNNLTFYQTNASGAKIPLNTVADYGPNDAIYHVLQVADPSQGKLIFPRTKYNPLYSSLPPKTDCASYEYLRSFHLLVPASAVSIIDNVSLITDTLFQSGTNLQFYELLDTLYYTVNPNHYNIEVDFLRKDPGNVNADPDGFVEFDWRKEFCTQSFDGRFPILNPDDNALEGTLTYSMNSLGMVSIFGAQTLKLRFFIKDQQLHQSNVVETTPFTLQ